MKTLVLDGDRIHDIPSFYAEINRVFMARENWTLGPSLDALDDVLHGGYGAAAGNAPVLLIWRNMRKNAADLGVAATRAYYQEKLRQPGRFNATAMRARLDALEAGTGQTYFDIVREIIAAHPRITLRAADEDMT